MRQAQSWEECEMQRDWAGHIVPESEGSAYLRGFDHYSGMRSAGTPAPAPGKFMPRRGGGEAPGAFGSMRRGGPEERPGAFGGPRREGGEAAAHRQPVGQDGPPRDAGGPPRQRWAGGPRDAPPPARRTGAW